MNMLNIFKKRDATADDLRSALGEIDLTTFDRDVAQAEIPSRRCTGQR